MRCKYINKNILICISMKFHSTFGSSNMKFNMKIFSSIFPANHMYNRNILHSNSWFMIGVIYIKIVALYLLFYVFAFLQKYLKNNNTEMIYISQATKANGDLRLRRLNKNKSQYLLYIFSFKQKNRRNSFIIYLK